MKTTFSIAFAVALAGFVATATVFSARASDQEDALEECLDAAANNVAWGGVISAVGCAAGYVIQTVTDEDEEQDGEDDAWPFPGSGGQAHVPLAAKANRRQTAVPQKVYSPRVRRSA